jgi:hypothetical protein
VQCGLTNQTIVSARRTSVTDKRIWGLFAAALFLASIAAGGWYHTNDALNQKRSQSVADELQPIAALLKDNCVFYKSKTLRGLA